MSTFSFHHKLSRIFICWLLFSLFTSLSCWPTNNDSARAARHKFDESQVRAVFLFNLTHFISWPESSFSRPDSPFVITILGDNPFGENLDRIVKNERVGHHPIIIRYIATPDQIQSPHILYISKGLKRQLSEILDCTSQPGLLTVSAFPGFSTAGGAVNLLIKQKRLSLELNIEAAKKNGLKFSSKLLRLAKIVEGEK